MLLPTADDVIAFWREAGADKWFARDDAFDASIKERFLALLEPIPASEAPLFDPSRTSHPPKVEAS